VLRADVEGERGAGWSRVRNLFSLIEA